MQSKNTPPYISQWVPYDCSIHPQTPRCFRKLPVHWLWWVSLLFHGADALLGCPRMDQVRGLILLTGLMGIPYLLLCLWASSCVRRWTFNHKTWHCKSVWSWFSLFCSQIRTMLCILQVWLSRVKGTFLSSVCSYFNHVQLWGNLYLNRTRIKLFSLLNWNTSLAPQLCNLCSWSKWWSSPGGRNCFFLQA